MKIPEQTIEEVKNRTDIVEVVGEFVSLKRRGKNYVGLCPFHQEKTPSFSVNTQMQIYHCFGCKAGGNAFKFLMEMEKVSFPEAVRKLAERAGVVVPAYEKEEAGPNDILYQANELAQEFFHRILLETKQGERGRKYFTDRQIGTDLITAFKLGYAPNSWDDLLNWIQKKGIPPGAMEQAGLAVKKDAGGFYNRFRDRVMFPIFHHGGRVIAFGGRILEGDGAKYINSPETPIYRKSQVLYGLNFAKNAVRGQNAVVIVEGYMDFIRVFAGGIENVVASSGTAFTPEQARLLKRYAERAVIVYDADTAGQEATLRGLDVLLTEGIDVRLVSLSDDLDPDELIVAQGADALRQLVAGAQDVVSYQVDRFSKQLDLKSVDGRTRLVHRIIATVAKVQDRIKRDLLVKDLAERFGIAETEINRELARVVALPRRTPAGDPMQPPAALDPVPASVPRVELEILKLMFHNQDFVDLVHERMSAKEFTHPACQTLAETMFQKRKKHETVDLALLVPDIPAPLADELLADLVLDEQNTDVTHMLKEDIAIIKKTRLDSEIKRIQSELQRTQTTGQEERTKGLFEKIQVLMKERERIKPV
jgi:DNA primase